MLDVGDALEIDGARTPHHANDVVAFVEQKFGEIRAVLSGDSRDERFAWHGLFLARSDLVEARRGPASYVAAMSSSKTAVICSHRLGQLDGVSIEVQKWQWALELLGWRVRTVAGNGIADRLVPGLMIGAVEPPPAQDIEDAFGEADIVIVENICSLMLNLHAANAVANVLHGRPAILHHHDLAIERPDRLSLGPPPIDAHWTHVCATERARTELALYGIAATVMYNRFEPNPPGKNRQATRQALGIGENETLMLQPTRAIARKGLPLGLRLGEELGAVYWILGPSEDGFDDELANLLSRASTRVISFETTPSGISTDEAYGACDLVSFPSTWEGFGNPAIESATYRRPLAIGHYPVAAELQAFGFRWFDANDPVPIASFLSQPDKELLEHNALVARRHFALEDLPRLLGEILDATLGRNS